MGVAQNSLSHPSSSGESHSKNSSSGSSKTSKLCKSVGELILGMCGAIRVP